MLHKSSTFSSFTSGTAKIGSWFSHIGDRRRKTSANSVLKTSKSLQLGLSLLTWWSSPHHTQPATRRHSYGKKITACISQIAHDILVSLLMLFCMVSEVMV
ncbi:hypothetical protein E2C01_072577 [Portunus trituberculatus]|uniref:Uncharacterized protein n=1 Tax=Portunus trituberculatus TaxID=210409 RepID=A0A5B7I873_PORTR|nr:hypothetical protein [Portunus trituberculatus]